MFSLSSHASLVVSYSLLLTVFAPVAPARSTGTTTPSAVVEQAPRRGNELLVRFRSGVSSVEKASLVASQGLRRKKLLSADSGLEKLELVSGDVESAMLRLRLNPQVELVEPNFLISKSELMPNDPDFSQQWALRNTGQNNGQFGSDINASSAWSRQTGSLTSVVAVIDSGIDLRTQIW